VQVFWVDNTNNETNFTVEKLNDAGSWQNARFEISRHFGPTGDLFSWLDIDTGQSAQCYRIANRNNGNIARSGQSCTVRPDSARFPQEAPQVTRQWEGLSNINGVSNSVGNGRLYNAPNSVYLYTTSKTWQRAVRRCR
jgi:hypothetical protein